MSDTLFSTLEGIVEDLSSEERENFVETLGTTLLESALLRTLSEISEEQSVALEYYLKTEPPADDLFTYLVKRCKGFETIFQEEVTALLNDTDQVLAT